MAIGIPLIMDIIDSAAGNLLISLLGRDQALALFETFKEEQIQPLINMSQNQIRVIRDRMDQGATLAESFRVFADAEFGAGNENFVGLADAIEDVNVGLAENTEEVTAGSSAALEAFTAGNDETIAARRASLDTARGLIDEFGEGQRRDIENRFDTAESSAAADLASRGIGGSTVSQSQSAMFANQESDALASLQDQILSQQLDVEQIFGGSAISAEEQANLAQFTGGERSVDRISGARLTELFGNQQGASLAHAAGFADAQALGDFVNSADQMELDEFFRGHEQLANEIGFQSTLLTPPPLL